MGDMWDKLGSVTSLEPGVVEESSSVMVESPSMQMRTDTPSPEEMLGTPEYNSYQQNKKAPEQAWYKSIPLDMLKGLIEGVGRLGRMMGPLPDQPGQEPFTMERFTESLDELIPTDSNMVGKGARRALNITPAAIANPLAAPEIALAQSAAGGALGQALEEGGFGEVAQSVGEMIPFFFGNASGGSKGMETLKKGSKISEKVSQSRFIPEKIRNIASKRATNANEINEIVDFATKSGMSADELVPLLQGDTKKKVLSKLAQRGGSTQDKLKRSKQAIDQIADSFKTGKNADIVLSEYQANNMINKLQDILYDMPAKTRNAIMEDFQQLSNSPKDTKSIIKFFRDINAQYGEHKAHLGRLKDPLMDALALIDPSMAKDFNITNKLYTKYYDLSSKLKPNVATLIMEASTIPKVLFGSVTGNYPLIAESIGEAAARKFSAELLTNPKFQNMGKKIVNALNKGQFAIADRLKEDYIRMVKDDYPEVAVEMQKESFKQFLED